MSYFARCSCNREIQVSAAQAGTAIDCDCGQRVPVPPLSVLRQQLGQRAYDVGIADRIRAKVAAGELPVLGHCAVCGFAAQDRLELDVVCERPALKHAVSWYGVVLGAIFLSVTGVLHLLHAQDEMSEASGRETVVPAPLCVDPRCGARLRRANQAQLRKILQSIPTYAQLLGEYPAAEIIVSRC
jgi:hypothetical protein